jgi:bacterioferritin
MAKAAREIVEGDVNAIIEEMNKALADEWLAYIQYMGAAALVKMPKVADSIKDVAKEELEHAEELSGRIIKLGGEPIADPKEFLEKTNCGYEAPNDNTIKALEDAIKGEGCAIKVYNKIAKLTKDADAITYQLILHIMEEEQEHEQKFQDLLDWIREMK